MGKWILLSAVCRRRSSSFWTWVRTQGQERDSGEHVASFTSYPESSTLQWVSGIAHPCSLHTTCIYQKGVARRGLRALLAGDVIKLATALLPPRHAFKWTPPSAGNREMPHHTLQVPANAPRSLSRMFLEPFPDAWQVPPQGENWSLPSISNSPESYR